MRKYSDDLIKILDQERSTKLKIDAFIKDLKHIEDQISYRNKLIEDKNSEIVQAMQNEDKEIKKLEVKIRDMKSVLVNTDQTVDKVHM